MEGIQILKARDLDLDLGSRHTAYHRASLIDLYLYTKFHSNRRNFWWTDGRTYGRTDIFPYIIRSTFGSRPKKPLGDFLQARRPFCHPTNSVKSLKDDELSLCNRSVSLSAGITTVSK